MDSTCPKEDLKESCWTFWEMFAARCPVCVSVSKGTLRGFFFRKKFFNLFRTLSEDFSDFWGSFSTGLSKASSGCPEQQFKEVPNFFRKST